MSCDTCTEEDCACIPAIGDVTKEEITVATQKMRERAECLVEKDGKARYLMVLHFFKKSEHGVVCETAIFDQVRLAAERAELIKH